MTKCRLTVPTEAEFLMVREMDGVSTKTKEVSQIIIPTQNNLLNSVTETNRVL